MEALSLLTPMACIKWPWPFACLFLGEMPSQQGIFPKRSLDKNPKIDLFSPTTKAQPLNPLTESPPLLYWLGSCRWCSSPCVSSTILYVCLLLLPHRFCHSCLISFCCMFVLIPHSETSVGSSACTASFYSLRGPGHCLGKSPYWSNSLGFHFCCSFSCHAYGLAMLAHWTYYLFHWAPVAHLLYFYLLLCP